MAEPLRAMKNIICPMCEKEFTLSHDEYEETETLLICSCTSGGIYAIEIRCPECGHREEVK